MRVLGHFAPWHTFGSEGIRTIRTISSFFVLDCFKYFFNIYFGTKCLKKNQIRKAISSLHV